MCGKSWFNPTFIYLLIYYLPFSTGVHTNSITINQNCSPISDHKIEVGTSHFLLYSREQWVQLINLNEQHAISCLKDNNVAYAICKEYCVPELNIQHCLTTYVQCFHKYRSVPWHNLHLLINQYFLLV